MELIRRRCTVCVYAVTELLAICLSASAFMHADTGDGHLAVCADCAEACKRQKQRGLRRAFCRDKGKLLPWHPVLRRCTGSS